MTGCPACTAMQRVLDTAACVTDRNTYVVDIEDWQDVLDESGVEEGLRAELEAITAYPTLFVFRGGEPESRAVGVHGERELKTLLRGDASAMRGGAP